MSTDPPTIADILTRLDQIAERLDQPTKRYLSVRDAASYCGVSQDSVRRLLSSGKVRRLKPAPGSVRIDKLELDEFLAGTADGSLVGGRGSWLKQKTGRGGLRKTPRPVLKGDTNGKCNR